MNNARILHQNLGSVCYAERCIMQLWSYKTFINVAVAYFLISNKASNVTTLKAKVFSPNI